MLAHLFVIAPCFLGVDEYSVEPIVGVHVVFGSNVKVYSIYIGKQLSVKLGGVTMVGDVFAGDGHLSTTDACTDIAHTIVVTNLLVQVVGHRFTSLRSKEHDAFLRFFVGTNQCTATAGGYHLIAVETHDTELTEGASHAPLVL